MTANGNTHSTGDKTASVQIIRLLKFLNNLILLSSKDDNKRDGVVLDSRQDDSDSNVTEKRAGCQRSTAAAVNSQTQSFLS